MVYGDFGVFWRFWAAKNKANSKPILVSPQIFWGLKDQFEKTKPIYSYCVLRDAYCEKAFEKTKPICRVTNWR